MGILILSGLFLLFFQRWIGFIPLTMGGLLCLGFRQLKASPVEVGIITVFGDKVPVVVDEGLTLLLDWLPFDIIGIIIIEAETKNEDFKDRVSARCSDGATVTGTVSVTFRPDYDDDDPAVVANPMSAGEKLILYANSGQRKGVIEQLDDIIVDCVKEIARKDGHTPDGHTYEWMSSNPGEIAKILRAKLCDIPPDSTSALGSAKRMGIKIINIQVELIPSDKVSKTDEDKVVERLQRQAELEDITTYKLQVDELRNGFVEDNRLRVARGELPIPVPSYEEICAWVDKQRTLKEGKRTVIEAGKLVNFNNVPK